MSNLTRIKNNQIVNSTIVASQKIQAGSITGSLFASNVTVPGDLLISGNLFVLGTSAYTTVASTNTYVNDPLLVLNNGFAGTNTYDQGFVFNRGSLQNRALIWSEFNQEFRLIGTTETGTAYGNVAVSNYANLHLGNLTVDYALTTGSLNTTGFINTAGNISAATGLFGAINSTGLINTSGNLSASQVSVATLNATGLINTLGNISASQGSFATINATGLINTSSNVSAAIVNAATVNASGNVLATVFRGGSLNVSGNVLASTVLAQLVTADDATFGNVAAGFIGNTGTAFTGASINLSGNVLASSILTNFLTADDVVFGNVSAAVFGNTGATYTGATINLSGNVLAGLAQFAAINNTPIGNITAATGAFTTLTATSVNSSGNILGAAATFSSSQVNGNQNVTGVLNVTGNILGATGTLSVLDLNSTTNATDATGTNGALQVSGGVSVAKDVWIGGNLYVSNIFGVSEQLIAVADPLLYLTASNTFPYTYDIGVFSHYTGGPSNVELHTGFVRDATDHYWKLFSNVLVQPTSAITFNGTENYDGLKIGNLQLTETGTAISAVGFINTTANISAAVGRFGSISSTGFINTSGNVSAAIVNGGAINSTGLINTTGNVSAATVIAGQFNTTGNLVAAQVSTGTLNATGLINTAGNVSAATVNAGQFNTTGNLLANTVTAYALGGIITTASQTNITTVGTLGSLNVTANVSAAELNIGTIKATGFINTTANISGATVIAGQFNTTGNLVAAQVSTGSLNATGLINTTGNISASRINADTLAATGTIWANATTDTTSLTTGALITAGGAAVAKTMWVGEGMRINSSQSAETFHVLGQGTNNSLIYADLAKNAIVFGGANAAVQDGAVAKFNSPGAIVVPVGTSAQRPGAAGNVDVAGMLRFSTTSNNLEFYDGSQWTAAGSTFTVIATNSFSGDDVQTAFTLSSNASTSGTLVMVNGVVQIPVTAYSVTGTTLQFTEAPATGDVIDARVITTTAQVTSIASANGYNTFDVATVPYANITAGTSSPTVRVSVDGVTGRVTFTNDVTINGSLTVLGDTNGNINIGNEPGDRLQLRGKTVYDQTAINVPNTNLRELDSFSINSFTTARYTVQVVNGVSVSAAELLVSHDDATSNIATYAVLGTIPGTFESNISSGTVRVFYTPSGAQNANIKLLTTYIV